MADLLFYSQIFASFAFMFYGFQHLHSKLKEGSRLQDFEERSKAED